SSGEISCFLGDSPELSPGDAPSVESFAPQFSSVSSVGLLPAKARVISRFSGWGREGSSDSSDTGAVTPSPRVEPPTKVDSSSSNWEKTEPVPPDAFFSSYRRFRASRYSRTCSQHRMRIQLTVFQRALPEA